MSTVDLAKMQVGAPHGAHSEHAGHHEHAGHSVVMFRDRFWGTLLLSIPTLVWAMTIQHWFGYAAPGGAAASRWIPAIFGSLVFAYGGWVFVKAAAGEAHTERDGDGRNRIAGSISTLVTYCANDRCEGVPEFVPTRYSKQWKSVVRQQPETFAFAERNQPQYHLLITGTLQPSVTTNQEVAGSSPAGRATRLGSIPDTW